MDVITLPYFFITYALIQTAIFLLLIRFLDLYEREPLTIVALMFVWGATGACAISIVGNGILQPLGPAISAPLVEETAKGLALVAAFLAAHWIARRFGGLEFEGLTDGLVYGAAVGLGFAFTEDFLYLLNVTLETGDLRQGLGAYASRVDFFGTGQLGHAIYTGTFGAGLGLATWSRSWVGRVGFPVLGLSAAMIMHGIHNGLAVLGAGTAMGLFDKLYLVAFVVVVALWLRYQRQVISYELSEEVNGGLITREEWEVMPRYLRRSKWYWQLLRQRRFEQWKLVRRVHNELADLAFLKWRLRKLGGDWNQVEVRRQRIAALRSQRVVEATPVGVSPSV